jgi:hypothetical protein
MIDTSIANDKKASDDELDVPETPIPTIKISTESDIDREHAALQKAGVYPNGIEVPPSPVPEEDESQVAEAGEPSRMKTPDLEKPQLAQTPTGGSHEAEGHGGELNGRGKGSLEKGKGKLELESESDDEAPSATFSNKRLCERWLDNLFMVLYEVSLPVSATSVNRVESDCHASLQDLRVYTIWRAEISHFKTQHMSYRKTGTEVSSCEAPFCSDGCPQISSPQWEILGELAHRLHHKEEAKDAFQRCLDSKFSAKAWMKLLEFYADENDLERTLNAAIRLTTYQHR